MFISSFPKMPRLYFYVSLAAVYVSKNSNCIMQFGLYKPKGTKSSDIKKSCPQYCLAILLTQCTTPQFHFINLIVQTKEIVLIKDENSYFNEFDYCPNSLEISREELENTLKKFIYLNGLVYNPEEGDTINQKNKNMFLAFQSMAATSKKGSMKITTEQFLSLDQGVPIDEGFVKSIRNYKLKGFLKEDRERISGNEDDDNVKRNYQELNLYDGYFFIEDSNVCQDEKNVLIYFIYEVTICFILFNS